MTTYVYETIPSKPGDKPRYFEIKQSIKGASLTTHPETGEPIRRVVLGGFGVLKKDGAAEGAVSVIERSEQRRDRRSFHPDSGPDGTVSAVSDDFRSLVDVH